MLFNDMLFDITPFNTTLNSAVRIAEETWLPAPCPLCRLG